MRLPFQPFSAQDVPQYAVPRPSPGVRPAPPVLPNLAANPELAMTRAVTGAIDNVIGAVSSYRKMIIDDKREAEREQEKARIELERQSAEGAADWYRKNSPQIRQIEEGLRTNKITKEDANKGLDALVRNAFPPPEAGPMSPVDQRTLKRIQDAVRSDYDTFMVIGAGQEQARKDAELNIFQNEAVQGFNDLLLEEAQVRIENPDFAVNPSELPEFYEKNIKNQKLLLTGKLRSAGYSDAEIKQQTELLETKLKGIGYTDQFGWMTQVSKLELEGRVLGVSNNLLAELNKYEFDEIRSNPDITPSQGVYLYEQKIEQLYKRPDFLSLPLSEQSRIINLNKVSFEQGRIKLQQDLTSEYRKTTQGMIASNLNDVISPPDGRVYSSTDEIEAAKDAITEYHLMLNESGTYPNEQTFGKAVHDSILQLERNTAQRMLNQGMYEKLVEELGDYSEGMFPTLDEKERGTFKNSAEAEISAGNTGRKAVSEQTIEDHFKGVLAGKGSVDFELIDKEVKAGGISPEKAAGYVAQAEYIEDAQGAISMAGGLEEMSNLQLENFLQEYEPYKREARIGQETIYTESQLKHYNAYEARIKAIKKSREDSMAADAHKRSQKLGNSQGIFDPKALPFVALRQQRIAPGSDFEFIPKEVVTEFNELWKQGGQQGQFFDGVSLTGNPAIDRGRMAARINNVKGDNYSALEEMAKRTGLDPMVLDLYAEFTNAGELERLGRLDAAANLKEVAALKREIGSEEDVNVDLKDVFSDTDEGEAYQKLLGLYAGNPQAQANLRSLAEKYVLIQKQNGASYEQALGTFVEDMQSTLDGRIVNAASDDNVQMSMILPDEHFKDFDPEKVVDFLVEYASDIAELPRDRINLDDLPKDQRDNLEKIIATNKALVQNGEVSYAFQNVNGGFQLVAFTGGVYTTLPIGITHEEVKQGVTQKAAEAFNFREFLSSVTPESLSPFGGSYGLDAMTPESRKSSLPVYADQKRGVFTGKKRPEAEAPPAEAVLEEPKRIDTFQRDLLNQDVLADYLKIQTQGSSFVIHKMSQGNPEAEAAAEKIVEKNTISPNKLPKDWNFRFKAVYIEAERIFVTSERRGIHPDLVMAMILTENEPIDPAGVGDKNLENPAYGLMQTRKGAFKDIKDFLKPPPEYTWEDLQDPNNWKIQLQAGIDYLTVLRDHHKVPNTYKDMAMAYNGGPEYKDKPPKVQARLSEYWGKVSSKFGKVDEVFGLK
jgi:hypothetical protein